MALLTHSGAGSTDLGSVNSATGTFTKREDISDYLLACLVVENNYLGLLEIGAETSDSVCRWEEDRLNNLSITDTSGLGSGTTFTVSASDAAIIDVGWVLMAEQQTSAGPDTAEQFQVTSVSGTTVTVTRSYGGTTQVSQPSGRTYRVVSPITYENSDLGRDMSRARITKTNIISRFELNVNISAEQILRALAGYAPGVPDEMAYQFANRVTERIRHMSQSVMYSRTSSGSTITGLTGDYATMAGTVAWLDGTVNSTASPAAQSGATLTDAILNAQNKTLYRNGTVPDWLVGGANMMENIGRYYNDRIRIEQNDRQRGFYAKYFTTSLGNELRLVLDASMYDTGGLGLGFILDSGRIRIRPLIQSLFYVIQSESFRDGDAVRALSKWTLEFRNTGSDVGAAHVMMTGLSF